MGFIKESVCVPVGSRYLLPTGVVTVTLTRMKSVRENSVNS